MSFGQLVRTLAEPEPARDQASGQARGQSFGKEARAEKSKLREEARVENRSFGKGTRVEDRRYRNGDHEAGCKSRRYVFVCSRFSQLAGERQLVRLATLLERFCVNVTPPVDGFR